MTLGMDVASGQDVLDGTDDIHPITPAALAEALTGGLGDARRPLRRNVAGDTMTGDLTVETDLFIIEAPRLRAARANRRRAPDATSFTSIRASPAR